MKGLSFVVTLCVAEILLPIFIFQASLAAARTCLSCRHRTAVSSMEPETILHGSCCCFRMYAWAAPQCHGYQAAMAPPSQTAIPPTERQQTSREPDSSWPSAAEGTDLLAMAACHTCVRPHFAHQNCPSRRFVRQLHRAVDITDSLRTTTSWQRSLMVWERVTAPVASLFRIWC